MSKEISQKMFDAAVSLAYNSQPYNVLKKYIDYGATSSPLNHEEMKKVIQEVLQFLKIGVNYD